MALPRIRVEVEADTNEAESGLNRVQGEMQQTGAAARAVTTRMGAAARSMQTAAGSADALADQSEAAARGLRNAAQAARAASAQVIPFNRNVGRVTGGTGAFGRSIQNVSFQLGDFATQVGAGTSASIALGQQLPQLLGGFGVLGAVLGAVVAIGVPLVRVLRDVTAGGTDLTPVLGELAPMAQTLAESFRVLRDLTFDLAITIVENLDRIVITAGTVAAFFAGRWVVSFGAARLATLTLAGALGALRVALIRTGIGALVIAAGELVFQFTRLYNETGSLGGALVALGGLIREVFSALGDFIVEVFQKRIIPSFQVLALRAGEAYTNLQANFAEMLGGMIDSAAGWANSFVNVITGAKDAAVEIFTSLPQLIAESFFEVTRSIASGISEMLNLVIRGINSLPSGLLDRIGLGDGISEIGDLGQNIRNPFGGAAADTASRARGAFEAAQGRNSVFDINADGTTALGDVARGGADILRGRADQRGASADAAGGLLSEPIAAAERLREILRSFREEGLDIPSLLEGRNPGEEGDGGVGGQLRDALEEGAGSADMTGFELVEAGVEHVTDAFKSMKAQAQDTWGTMIALVRQFAGDNKAVAIGIIALQKAYNIAQIVMNTAVAQTRALAELGPILGPPAAAKIGAFGAVQAGLVAAQGIAQSVAAAGGGRRSTGGTAGLAGIAQQPQNAGTIENQGPAPVQQTRTLSLIGERFSRRQAIEIAEFMNDGTDDGLVIRGRG